MTKRVAADDPGVLRRQRQREALLIGGALAALALAIVTQSWAWRVDRVLCHRVHPGSERPRLAARVNVTDH